MNPSLELRIPTPSTHVYGVQSLTCADGSGSLQSRLHSIDEDLQNRVFLTFGGPNEEYRNRSHILAEEAKATQFFTSTIGLTDDFLRTHPEFWEKHGEFIESNRTGYGFWMWKPFIIKTMLDKLNDGDILIYADAGCTINAEGMPRLLEYIKMFDSDQNGFGLISFQLVEREIGYTKRILLEYMDTPRSFMNSGQFIGGVQIIKKNAHSKMVINKWYDIASIYDIINDEILSEHEYPEFIEHRRDQSIYSLLVKKYGSIQLPDETFFFPDWSTGRNYPIWATRIRA